MGGERERERSIEIGVLLLAMIRKIGAYHLANEPVAPLFAIAVSVHYSQQSDHSYLSAQNKNHKRNVTETNI